MINEFQHKGYALLFGFIALVFTFIFWGIMPPFYWLGALLVYFYLGVQIGQGGGRGRWAALGISLLPVWLILIVLSINKQAPYVHLVLMAVSLFAGIGGVRVSGWSPRFAEFLLRHIARPLFVGLLAMLVATLLMFLVSILLLWPWKEVPVYAVLLPLAMTAGSVWLSRRPDNLWWRDTLLVCAVPLLYFSLYLPLFYTPDPRNLLNANQEVSIYTTVAVWIALLLAAGLSWLLRKKTG